MLSLSSNPCSGTTLHISFCATDERHSTIGVLADNVLLEIFYFYQEFYRINPDIINPRYRGPVMPLTEWRRLMHVCRRWRQIIFESSHRLNLQILCTHGNRFKKSLDIWPDFPIAIDDRSRFDSTGRTGPIEEDDVIAALEHPDRVCHIELEVANSIVEKMTTMLHKPFPVLKCLDICPWDDIDFPSGFLGGSAPCLEELSLSHISFPALPTLLSSAKNLVNLTLWGVPPSGYISPDTMVACLAELPRLNALCLLFKSATVRLGQKHPPPLTRTVLPALTHFRCPNTNEYLEDLVALIDCPELEDITVSYSDPVHAIQVAQLAKFINRTVGPEISPFTTPTKVCLHSGDTVIINTYRRPNHLKGEDWDPAKITIFYSGTYQQVSHVAQVLNRFSAILSTVTYLLLVSEDCRLMGTDNVEWLHSFSAVQTLHVSRELAGRFARALEDIPAESVNEVLPSLRLIFLEPHWPASSLEKFVAARGLSDRPVTVVNDKKEFDEILQSFVLGLEGVTE